jgi:hypothetical protein
VAAVSEVIAVVLVVAIQAAGMVVLFMMLTRRGWWKDPDIGIDWTTTDGCHACWEYGPYEGWRIGTLGDPERAREVHKAQHALIAPVARTVVRLVDRVNHALTR